MLYSDTEFYRVVQELIEQVKGLDKDLKRVIVMLLTFFAFALGVTILSFLIK